MTNPIGAQPVIGHTTSSEVFGLSMWRFHVECPKYIGKGEGKQNRKARSPPPPPKKKHKANSLGGHKMRNQAVLYLVMVTSQLSSWFPKQLATSACVDSFDCHTLETPHPPRVYKRLDPLSVHSPGECFKTKKLLRKTTPNEGLQGTDRMVQTAATSGVTPKLRLCSLWPVVRKHPVLLPVCHVG